MNPVLTAALRRHWQLIGAIAAFLLFTGIHVAWFKPAAVRYRDALRQAGGEAALVPGGGAPLLPPRVFATLAENTLSAQDAVDRGSSGALGVILLEDLGRVAERASLTVLGSDPGEVTQDALTTQVRAHLRLRGPYSEVVAFFDELARASGLPIVERFRITPTGDGSDVLEVWVSRLYLKQTGPAR